MKRKFIVTAIICFSASLLFSYQGFQRLKISTHVPENNAAYLYLTNENVRYAVINKRQKPLFVQPPMPGHFIIDTGMLHPNTMSHLYWYIADPYFILAIEYSVAGFASSDIVWLDVKTHKITKKIKTYGFNLAKPVIIGNHIYYSTIDRIGKIALAGADAPVWEHKNLYRQTNGMTYANSFNRVVKSGQNIIFSDSDDNNFIVDDLTGKLTKPYPD